MNWLAFLNPLNWVKIYSLLKNVFGLITSAVSWVNDTIKKWRQKKSQEQTDGAIKKANDANQISDDQKRLEQKKEAACELEKSFDPNSKC